MFLFFQSQIFQHGAEKQTNEAFETKTAFGPNFKAGMDATITDGSFATILSDGSAVMPPKSIDLINFVWRHLFHNQPFQLSRSSLLTKVILLVHFS